MLLPDQVMVLLLASLTPTLVNAASPPQPGRKLTARANAIDMRQASRESIVRRHQLKEMRKRSADKLGLVPRANPSCSAAPQCPTKYQPTTQTYALFRDYDLYYVDSSNTRGINDLRQCVDYAKQSSSNGGLYYVPPIANNSGNPQQGSCIAKGTDIASGSWNYQHDPSPASTLFFGSCCDYYGLVPSAVQQSCCQTRVCQPSSYPTCNSTYNTGANWAVFPNYDPYDDDVFSPPTSVSVNNAADAQSSTVASWASRGAFGYYFIWKTAGSGAARSSAGNYLQKGTAINKISSWQFYHDKQSLSAFPGTCCDYAGLFPSNVMGVCCNGS